MTRWSILVGIVGMLGAGLVLGYLRRRKSDLAPERYWLCGLAALAPAWLISLLALLEQWTGQGPDTPLPPSVILSSSAALLAVIITDWAVRHLDRRGPAWRAMTYWLLGVLAFVPAWAIALWALP
ncbi:MAG: hypothetical protein ACE5JU_17540 [Candidatus Binatia bacterium]